MVFVVDSSPKKEVETGIGRNFGVWGMGECGSGIVGEWVKGENGGSSSGGAGYMDRHDFEMILG